MFQFLPDIMEWQLPEALVFPVYHWADFVIKSHAVPPRA